MWPNLVIARIKHCNVSHQITTGGRYTLAQTATGLQPPTMGNLMQVLFITSGMQPPPAFPARKSWEKCWISPKTHPTNSCWAGTIGCTRLLKWQTRRQVTPYIGEEGSIHTGVHHAMAYWGTACHSPSPTNFVPGKAEFHNWHKLWEENKFRAFILTLLIMDRETKGWDWNPPP